MNPKYRNAIGTVESDNNYAALGPITKSGDRAYGRYQVMGVNVPEWTRTHLGVEMTPDQFLADKNAQDTVFDKVTKGYHDKYGNTDDVTSSWFSGRPLARAGNDSDGYNTVPEYVAKVNKHMGPVEAINAAAGVPSSPGALTMAYADDKPALATPPGALYGGSEPDYANVIGSGLTGVGSALAGITSPAQAAALNQQSALMKKAGADGAWSMHVTPSGQMFRINGKTGAMQPVAGDYAKKEPNEYDKAYDKSAAEGWVKKDAEITDHADKATGMLGDLAQVRAALANPKLTTGQFGETIQKGRSMLAYFDPELAKTAADGDVVNALTHKMALQLVKADKLLPGSMSDSDRVYVAGLTPGLALQPEANARLLAIIEKSSMRAKETEAARAEYAAANGGRLNNGFRAVQNEMNKKWMAEDKAAADVQTQTNAPIKSGPLAPNSAYVWTPQGMQKK